MAIEVKCSCCEHTWSVPSAKAGRSTYCPECDEGAVVPKSRATTRRSASKTSSRAANGSRLSSSERSGSNRSAAIKRPRPQASNAKLSGGALLAGAAIVLVGVCSLVGYRLYVVASDEDLVFDTSPITGTEGDASVDHVSDHAETADSSAESSSVVQGESLSSAAPPEDDSQSSAGRSLISGGRDARISKEVQVRKILSEMQTVRVKVERLSDDLRGDVQRTVESSVLGAMEACMLVCTDASEAMMNVQMEIRTIDGNERLWLVAALAVGNAAQDEVLWKHSADMGPISQQALETGIVPPNLRRDSSLLFTDLRASFVAARREFGTRKPGRVRTLRR